MKLSLLSHGWSFLLANNHPTMIGPLSQLHHGRRDFVTSVLTSSVTLSTSSSSITTTKTASSGLEDNNNDNNQVTNPMVSRANDDWRVTLPLEYGRGGVSTIRMTVYSGNTGNDDANKRRKEDASFRVYRVIVDSGSPYVVLSSSKEDILFENNNPVAKKLSWTNNNNGIGRNKNKQRNNENDIFFDSDSCTCSSSSIEKDGESSDETCVSYEDTQEIYGSQLGNIQWRRIPISFRDFRLVTKQHQSKFVLGVLDDVLTQESGGSLIGLIKNTNPSTTKIQLRPTFLNQQTIMASSTNNQSGSISPPTKDITSFQIDFPNRKLTLSSTDLIIPTDNNSDSHGIMPLVDLRKYGDFVDHYACLVQELIFHDSSDDGALVVNSQMLEEPSQYSDGNSISFTPRPIVAVFDTGLTGCLLTQPFWDQLVKLRKLDEHSSKLTNQNDKDESNRIMNVDPSKFTSIQVKIAKANVIPTFDVGTNRLRKPINKSKKKVQENNEDIPCVNISSTKSTNPFFYVAPISLDWFDDEATAPHVIVLGQTFLSQGALTIDIDQRRTTFVKQ